jgi:Flp pilus assembly protein CpaB
MNRRITMSLLAACLISGVCTYVLGRKVSLAASPRNQRVLRYAAAARPLDAGEVLNAADLTSIPWPVASPLHGALGDIDKLPGRVVMYPLEQGQPILERDLADPGTGGGLASRRANPK